VKEKIYALYPLDDNGKALGVYVGITSDVSRRMKEHLYSNSYYYGNEPITDFAYQVLDEPDNTYTEYDFIDLFKISGIPLLNQRIGNHANYQNALIRLLGKIEFYGLSRTDKH